MPTIAAVSTATPPNRLSQAELRDAADAMVPDGPAKAGVLALFASSRIRSRALAMPLEWYVAPHGHRDRAQAYVQAGLLLAEQAARSACAQAGIAPERLDGIVFVSTTGLATPSLDARLCGRLGLRPDALRLPAWGWGCAGGVAGVNRAADLAAARPGTRMLVVCLELCSLLFDLDATRRAGSGAATKKAAVAASLFGDGCAAAIVQGDGAGGAASRDGTDHGPGPTPQARLWHRGGASHLWPASEHVMGWDVADGNLDVVLSPDIPAIVRDRAGAVVARFVAGCAPGQGPDHWVLHPGGPKVVDAFADALGLDEGKLQWTNATLADHGNMSSPTVLFALERALASGRVRPGDRLLLGALGPGFACELAMLEAA